MNFVLTFFAYGDLRHAMVTLFGKEAPTTYPPWFVSQRALVGLAIGFFVTTLGSAGFPAT